MSSIHLPDILLASLFFVLLATMFIGNHKSHIMEMKIIKSGQDITDLRKKAWVKYNKIIDFIAPFAIITILIVYVLHFMTGNISVNNNEITFYGESVNYISLLTTTILSTVTAILLAAKTAEVLGEYIVFKSFLNKSSTPSENEPAEKDQEETLISKNPFHSWLNDMHKES